MGRGRTGVAATIEQAWGSRASFYVSPASVALLMLNLLDGLFTLLFLQLGVAEELNPLMRVAYEQSPLIFMGSKLVIVNAGLWLLCLHRRMKASRIAIRAGAVVYGIIVVYHLAFLTHLVLHWPGAFR
ncbi:hypothetical protein HPC49_51175 [Pyxidicoccus fallax]|uniref:DUF5658 domain-containing protein n=1 Tax=Pyxidicoccus fallax TaxID=394095 RepID=A0A848M0M6_9BACT|nr:hypothetical protein [Pyxidicoccus fallax]NPC86538.1 hypothetical protein [Pyxidicoccus fallax]